MVKTWNRFASISVYAVDLAHSAAATSSVLSMQAVDPKTVSVKLAFPDATLLKSLAFDYNFWVIPNGGVDAGFNTTSDARGSGPFMLTSYKPSVGFTYQKNPNYYDAPRYPYVDSIDMPIITNSAQAEAQFKAKNIYGDYTGGASLVVPTDILSIYDGLKGQTYIAKIGPGSGASNSLSFGLLERPANKPFRDKRVRQAISMLIDRNAFLDTFNNVNKFVQAGIPLHYYWNAPISVGYGEQWQDPTSGDFGPDAQYLQHNVAEAKKLLAAAGYPNGFQTMLTTLATPQYGLDWKDRGEALSAMLADGGVQATVNALDYTSAYVPHFLRGHDNYDGMAMNASGAEGDGGLWYFVWLSSKGGFSVVQSQHPELEAKITAVNQELDNAKRVQMIHDLNHYAIENMFLVPQPGTSETLTLSWNGLHGPGQVFPCAVNGTPGAEYMPYLWLDGSLRG